MGARKKRRQPPAPRDTSSDLQSLMWSRFRRESLKSAASRRRLRDLIYANFASLSIPAPCSERDIVLRIAADSQKPIPIDHLCSELDSIVLSRGVGVFGSPGKYFDEIAHNYPDLYWWLSDKGLRMEIFRENKRSPDFNQFAGQLMSQTRSKRDRKYFSQSDYQMIAEQIDKAGFPLRDNLQGKYSQILSRWNQYHPDKKIETFREAIQANTGFFYKRFIEGLWVVAEGAIYKDSWSDELLYDLEDEPPGLRQRGGHQQRVVSIDYGTTNPMVFLDIFDDGKVFWVVREYYWDSAVQMRQKTDAEYADDLVDFIGLRNDAKVIIDPSAASFKAEMLKRGIWHADAEDEVNEGIRIASMILNQRLVRFCRQTTSKTIQEMQTYAWDSKAAQRGEEKPLKVHDHGPDAFRYFAKSEVPYWRLAD